MRKIEEKWSGVDSVGNFKILKFFYSEKHGQRNYCAEVECQLCGTVKVYVAARLKRFKSCGCEKNNNIGNSITTHGMTKTKTYRAWSAMWSRCTNKNYAGYESYKDRTPPEEWKSFEKFLEDMGEAPENYSLERKDNDKPYSADNCMWLPVLNQAKNRGNTIWVLYGETKLCFSDAAKIAGVKVTTGLERLKRGWSMEETLGPNFKNFER